MTTDFISPCTNGDVFVVAEVASVGSTVGFSRATMYADRACTKIVARYDEYHTQTRTCTIIHAF